MAARPEEPVAFGLLPFGTLDLVPEPATLVEEELAQAQTRYAVPLAMLVHPHGAREAQLPDGECDQTRIVHIANAFVRHALRKAECIQPSLELVLYNLGPQEQNKCSMRARCKPNGLDLRA